ncbi:hypothetical protein CLAIMM_01812 [Cladophialophora immunda]|nr:hypothetical protein CLAIMM_01812 [Cladophialophora immunda]
MAQHHIHTRWGILGTGVIAKQFAQDMCIGPVTRGVSDVTHQIVAVGSQTSIQKAQDFVNVTGLKNAHCYGTYEDFLRDETIDVVYITTSAAPEDPSKLK